MSMAMVVLFLLLVGYLGLFVALAIDQYKTNCRYRQTLRVIEQAAQSVDYVCNEIREKCLVDISADLFYACLEEMKEGGQE